MKPKVKLCLIFLGIIVSIIQSCGSSASGCGGGPYYEYDPAIYISGFTINDSSFNNNLDLELLSPYYEYYPKRTTNLPFIINVNQMTFKVSINGIVRDTMTINYEPKLVYIPESLCDSEEFDVNCEVKNITFKNKVITGVNYTVNEREI